MRAYVVGLGLLAGGCTFGGGGAGSGGDGDGSGSADSTGAAETSGVSASTSASGPTGSGSASADGTTSAGDTASDADDTTAGLTMTAGSTSRMDDGQDDDTDDGQDDDPTETDGDTDGDDTGVDCTDAPTTACLVDTGLLGRYFMDEEESGTASNTVFDWAPDPVDLEVQWMDGMTYVTNDGNTGIEWQSVGGDGSVYRSIEGTKLTTPDGQTAVTLEIVLELDNASGGARVLNFGQGQEGGLLTARMASLNQPRLYWQAEVTAGAWTYDFGPAGRVVMHMVLDTEQADDNDRRRLYINGQLAGGTPSGDVPLMGEQIDLQLGDGPGENPNPEFALGNRFVGGRSIDGIIYYAAIYDAALTAQEIEDNAAILIEDDDSPE